MDRKKQGNKRRRESRKGSKKQKKRVNWGKGSPRKRMKKAIKAYDKAHTKYEQIPY